MLPLRALNDTQMQSCFLIAAWRWWGGGYGTPTVNSVLDVTNAKHWRPCACGLSCYWITFTLSLRVANPSFLSLSCFVLCCVCVGGEAGCQWRWLPSGLSGATWGETSGAQSWNLLLKVSETFWASWKQTTRFQLWLGIDVQWPNIQNLRKLVFGARLSHIFRHCHCGGGDP